MADEQKLELQVTAGINKPESQQQIEKALKQVQEKLRPLNLKVDDTKLLNSLKAQFDKQNNLNKLIIQATNEQKQQVAVAFKSNKNGELELKTTQVILNNKKLQTEELKKQALERKKYAEAELYIQKIQDQQAKNYQSKVNNTFASKLSGKSATDSAGVFEQAFKKQDTSLYNNLLSLNKQITQYEMQSLNAGRNKKIILDSLIKIKKEEYDIQKKQLTNEELKNNLIIQERKNLEKLSLKEAEISDGGSMTKSALTGGKSFFGKIYNTFAYTAGYYLLNLLSQPFTQSVKYISDMDKALTDLNKVVDLSKVQMDEMRDSAIEMGKALGQSSVDIAKSMAEFGRISKNIDEIQALTRTAVMASNVTSLSPQEAAKALTSAMISFNLEAKDSLRILDAWNALQNNYRISAEDVADSIGKVGAAAKLSKVSMEELAGITTAIVSATGISGSEAGTAIKGVLGRLFKIGEDGIEDAGKSEELLNSLGIAVRKNATEFRSLGEILDDIKSKWGEWDSVTKQSVSQQIAGQYHYSKLIALLDNYNIKVNATTTALHSQGSAMEENEKYLNSIEGRMNILKTTAEGLYSSVLNSDMFKGFLSGATQVINVIQRTINGLGGFGSAMLLVANISIPLLTSGISFIIKNIADLSTAFQGLQVVKFFSSPMGIAVGVMTAVTVAIVSLINHKQKLQEQLEKTSRAQNDFNGALNDFNTTLNPEKINQVADALERLKSATNYDKNIEQIAKLQKEIAQLEQTNLVVHRDGFAYGTNDIAIANKKAQLVELEKVVNRVNEAEEKYNKTKELANALDYSTVQQKVRQVAQKVREADANVSVANSYKVVYDKLIQGIALTQEETQLNEQLLQQYPQYVQLLDKKNKILGVNHEALKNATDLQKNLAQVEFEEYKISIQSNATKTQVLIDETSRRVDAISSEVEALDSLIKSYAQLSASTGDLSDMSAETFAIQSYNRSAQKKNELLVAKSQLEKLKTTGAAYDSIVNSTFEDLLKSNTNDTKYFPPISSENKDASDNSNKDQVEREKEYLNSLIKVYEDFKTQTENSLADLELQDKLLGEDDYTNQLDNLNKRLILINEQLGEAEKNLSNLQAVDTTGWTKEAVDELNKFTESASDEIRDIKGEQIDLKINIRNVTLDGFENAYDKALRKMQTDKLQIDLDEKSIAEDDYDGRISLINRRIEAENEELKIMENYLEQLKSSSDGSVQFAKKIEEVTDAILQQKGSVQELKNNMVDMTKSSQKAMDSLVEDISDKTKQIYKKMASDTKQSLDDQLDIYESYVDKKLKLLDDEFDKEDFQNKLNEENRTKSQLEAKRNELLLDSSIEGQTKRKDIEEQIRQQEKVLSDLMQQKNREDRKRNLESNLVAERDRINKEKLAVDTKYNDAAIEQMAKTALLEGKIVDTNGKVIELKNAFAMFLKETGESLGVTGAKIESDLINKLEKAQQIVAAMATSGAFANTSSGSISSSSSPPMVLSSQQSSKLSGWVKNLNLPNFTPKATDYKVSENNSGTVNLNISSLIGNVQGSVDKSSLPYILDAVKTQIPKIVAEAQVNMQKKLGIYQPKYNG